MTDKTSPMRALGDTHQRLGSSPTIGAAAADEPGGAVAAAEERAPPPRGTLVGRTLGKNYRVLEPIGAGGMGIVYLVEHVKLKKRFAAKVLNSELAMNAEACARFEVEAHAVSQLEHDNIINVIDYGTSEDGLVFMVMEYLKGRTLQARIDQAPLNRDELFGVMQQVCHALGCAHEAGIVHRDMKPDNIFLNERMRGRPPLVKVLDFGISKARDVSLKDGRITKQGQVLGSPEYMSPEAARGDEVDPRADIYAVGIILYELVTGTVPFRSENYLKVLQQHISEKPVPASQHVPDLSPEMERLILRALAKHPDGRQQDMAELENELIDAMPDEAHRVMNPRRTPSGGGWLLTPPIGVPTTTAPLRPISESPAPAPATPPHSADIPVVVDEEPLAIEAAPAAVELSLRPRRRLIGVGIAALVIAIGAIVAIRMAGDDGRAKRPASPPVDLAAGAPAPPTAEPAPSPAPPIAEPPPSTPPPAVGPEPAPPPAPAATTIPVRIDSTPRGAAVYLNGKLLGKTPLSVQVGRGRKPGQLRVALRDHAPVTRKVDLLRPVELVVRLERAAAARPDAGPKPLELRQTR